MNYIGSKLSLLPFLEKSIKEAVGDISDKIFFDLFAGTGVVANHFNGLVKTVIANDTEIYSYILNCNLLKNYTEPGFENFDLLNYLEPVEGFIWKYYSPAGGRLYFTEDNAKKIDAVRKYLFSEVHTFFSVVQLSAALIEAADKVANTTSVYGAYLKKFQSTSIKPFTLKPIIAKKSFSENYVFRRKAEEIIDTIKTDILYMDPPYNHRQYGANYHLLNTLVSVKEFIPQGITGLPENYNKSVFCSKRTVEKAFVDIIEKTKAEHVFLSYNNEGLLSLNTIEKIMKKFGDYSVFSTDYKTYKADSKRNNKSISTIEYLHYLHKKR